MACSFNQLMFFDCRFGPILLLLRHERGCCLSQESLREENKTKWARLVYHLCSDPPLRSSSCP